jgi:hypothetical protein
MLPADGELVTLTNAVSAAVPQPKLLVTVNVIIAVPKLTPVTTPVAGSTVATAASLLLHAPVPPVNVVLDKVDVVVGQTVAAPVIVPAVGAALTVTVVVT